MRVLLWACGLIALIGVVGSGLSQSATPAAFLGHVAGGVAALLVFGWLGETLSAVRRAASALEEMTIQEDDEQQGDDEQPERKRYHRSGLDIILGRKK